MRKKQKAESRKQKLRLVRGAWCVEASSRNTQHATRNTQGFRLLLSPASA